VREGDMYICSGEAGEAVPHYCRTFGTKTCQTLYTCGSGSECSSQSCLGTTYKCYYSNAGSYTWATTPPTETACSDGHDNDCDGKTDSADPDCGATCSRNNPSVSIAPPTQSAAAGSTLTYTATVTNNDNSACGSSTFGLSYSCPSGWTCSLNPNSLSITPGSSDTSTFSVKSSSSASVDDYIVSTTATNNGAPSYTGTGSATYSVTSAPTSTTTVLLDPSYVASGQEVNLNLTIIFSYANYNQGEDANISLYIIPQGCTEQSCYIRWDSSNGCGMGWKKWKTGLNWDGSPSWQSADGKMKITSRDDYATIETKCIIPSGLSSGTHKVRAIPTIYSLPITLRAAEVNFIVLNDFELAFQKIFDSISSAIQQMFAS